jgi:hypothetical protein
VFPGRLEIKCPLVLLEMCSIENEIEVALPTAELKEVTPGVSFLPTLTHRGYGPGLILILPKETPITKKGVPFAMKVFLHQFLNWSEEGFECPALEEIGLIGMEIMLSRHTD